MSTAARVLPLRPRKGELTRQAILQKAASLASRVGLAGVTIGRLAEELGLSKSGLFAHFRSKEALQEQVLEFAAQRFIEAVARPAVSAPRGEPRVRALFDRRAIRDRFRRAPWAFAFALLVLLLAAIPLYLLKIEMIPREAAWLPCLVFVLFLAPARLLTGWAYARSARRERPRHWLLRLLGRLAIVPAALLYVLVVFAAQYTSWGGASSLLEQHAFLVPVPFLGL